VNHFKQRELPRCVELCHQIDIGLGIRVTPRYRSEQRQAPDARALQLFFASSRSRSFEMTLALSIANPGCTIS
jgi:hypothetical protein